MMKYNWQQSDWPNFRYDLREIEEKLFSFAEGTGRTGGLFEGLPKDVQTETIVNRMVAEAVKTSEIEGEYLSRKDVVSSIRKNLGIIKKNPQVKDERAEGAAAFMIDVRETCARKLTQKKPFSWHKMIMKGSKGVKIGNWRTRKGAMQVVSGPVGREKVHFEAPPSDQVPLEMKDYVKWFNESCPGGKNEIRNSVIFSAIAHLYFESIHPFEDGNGRIGRALSLSKGFEPTRSNKSL